MKKRDMEVSSVRPVEDGLQFCLTIYHRGNQPGPFFRFRAVLRFKWENHELLWTLDGLDGAQISEEMRAEILSALCGWLHVSRAKARTALERER